MVTVIAEDAPTTMLERTPWKLTILMRTAVLALGATSLAARLSTVLPCLTSTCHLSFFGPAAVATRATPTFAWWSQDACACALSAATKLGAAAALRS